MLRAHCRKALPSYAIDIQLHVPASSVTALVGPSGAGKTTLLRIIAGLECPDAGSVHLGAATLCDTQEGIHVPPHKRGLGFLMQESPLLPHKTLEDNVLLAAPDHTFAQGLIDRFGLAALRRQKPQTLSGGQRQRAALAQVLARKPRALLLDEPFAALDARTRTMMHHEVMCVVRQLHLPVLMVTHDLHEALQLAQTLLPVVDGSEDHSWLDAIRECQSA